MEYILIDKENIGIEAVSQDLWKLHIPVGNMRIVRWYRRVPWGMEWSNDKICWYNPDNGSKYVAAILQFEKAYAGLKVFY